MSKENILENASNDTNLIGVVPVETAEELDLNIDYSTFAKEDLAIQADKLSKEQTDIQVLFGEFKKIKTHADDLLEQEKSLALNAFIEEGGEEGDFEYKIASEFNSIDALFKSIREKYYNHQNQLQNQRENNLKLKQDILIKLRQLVDSEENNSSWNKFKALEAEWKAAGAVPPNYAQELWANYRALVDRFYNNRSIYFELKELDKKKNLEAKKEVCVRAEKLVEEVSVGKALRELNDLHNEFKNIGPVPNESQEEIWNRLKVASDAIYDRKKNYLEEQEKALKINTDKKLALLEVVNTFATYTSEVIKDWNNKTEEMLALREQWAKIGPATKDRSSDLNKQFWAVFKTFFSAKGTFYKNLDEQRSANLKLKEKLSEQAEAAFDNSDLEKAINVIKRVQAEWKKIGPVPRKYNNAIFDRFKKACDAVFDKKRSLASAQDVEFEKNAVAKKAICDKFEASTTFTEDELFTTLDEWSKIGFVPRGEVVSISKRFDKAVDKYVAGFAALDEAAIADLKLRVQVRLLKNSPDAKANVVKKEQTLRRKIKELQDEVVTLGNNLEFFAKSKNADILRKEVEGKIKSTETEIAKLSAQLKLITSALK